MSEASEIRELAPEFLRITYEIGMNEPSDIVMLHQVAEQLQPNDLGTTGSDYVAKLATVAQYLGRRGFLRRQSSDWGMFSITREGLAEVEADPAIAMPPEILAMPPEILATPDEFSTAAPVGKTPVEIQESFDRFGEDHPDPAKVAFIMMQFGKTRAHTEVTEAVRLGLAAHGIQGVRADDKRYHDHVFFNILTYLHGCGLGIAIYDRIETDTYNPNVALEVGYLFAMRKPVCLLKDQTLTTLPTDLVGQLYDPFDPQDADGTIPPVLSKWLSDKGLV